MRAAIYARVSTQDQSCEMQMRDLQAYCALAASPSSAITSTSASRGRRTRVRNLTNSWLTPVNGSLTHFLVWRFDRFARSTKHLLLALEEFRSLGVQRVSYQENIDTSSPLGQALFTIVSAVAQLERDLIRERVRAGLRNAKLKGKPLGRPPLTLDRDRIARLRASGASIREISAQLETRLRQRKQPLERLPTACRDAGLVSAASPIPSLRYRGVAIGPSMIALTGRFLPIFNNPASVVLMTSINSHIGMPNSSVYGATKRRAPCRLLARFLVS